MSRFNEGYVFRETEPMGAPGTLNILLTRLGVFFKPQAEQRAAVEAWLVDNTPGPRLRDELRNWVDSPPD